MAKEIALENQDVLNEKRSDPIPMKNKEDLRTDNEGTEVKTTVVEKEAKLENPKKSELPGNEPENKQGEEEGANKDGDPGTSTGH